MNYALTLELTGLAKAGEYLDKLDNMHKSLSGNLFTEKGLYKKAVTSARTNLASMNSVVNGGLAASLHASKNVYGDGFLLYWGAKNTAKGGFKMHFLNSGTIPRYTVRSHHYTGIVGRANTAYTGRNYLFRTGFADRASDAAGLADTSIKNILYNFVGYELENAHVQTFGETGVGSNWLTDTTLII